MTRQQTYELIFDRCKIMEGKEVANLLDALEVLGLLKFEDAPPPDCRELHIRSSEAGNNGVCVKVYKAIEALEAAGYKVDKR